MINKDEDGIIIIIFKHKYIIFIYKKIDFFQAIKSSISAISSIKLLKFIFD